ncbi:MAG: cation-translocating P-type ATPase [Peptostreptococcaceae bacterium]|nr:cation-translocating P-type ATPase [Peptostreptococcaceae bacterium]
MIPHHLPPEKIGEEFGTSLVSGLTDAQIQKQREAYGENKLKEKRKRTLLERYLDQFKDVMIIILLIAAAISFGVAIHEGNPKEFFEPVLILAIVILNAIMGVMQESKAEAALEALKSLTALKARVIRNGSEQLIDSVELVPGDIIKLEAGDFIPADARLFKSSAMKSEESALTGESVPTEKDANAIVDEKAPLGDRSNMVFSGNSITYGTGMAIVTATGMDTEVGKIANLLESETNPPTPLQQKLADLGKYLGVVALLACAVIFVIGIIDKIPILDIFMTSVALAVSAIPEGLPAIVTIVLSIGVQRMVKKNAIIRRLPAVETLGSASVICSDKTGTLTQNRMTLLHAFLDGAQTPEDITHDNSQEIKKLLAYATLCCDGSIITKEDGTHQHIGDPTETAIVLAAQNNGLYKDALNEKHPRMSEIPFDSDRKLMSTVNKIDGKNIVIVKGAFDVLSKRCKQGNVEKASEVNAEMANNALRVLAIAYKEIDNVLENPKSEELEKDLTFMGLVAMIDPPREEAKDAVAICKRAGIRPIMITGDHQVTAAAIARELGILNEGDKVINGTQLQEMSEEQLAADVEKISVYARVSPEDKIRIVKAWQDKNQIVAMTGDGVNDAPALKAADIGCAMGITGTDVAKGAADMTLTDDNFATIVDAVREGRGIYANIKKVVGFLLGTNTGEILTVLVAIIIWKQSPLLSMHLLWINLVTDALPAISLGMEAVEDGIMNHKPKSKDEGLFANGLAFRIVMQGAMFAALTLIGYHYGFTHGGVGAAQTMAFIVLASSQIVQAYNMRSNRSLFKIGFFTNKNLNMAALASIVLILVVLFTPLSVPFGIEHLPMNLYLIAIGLAFVPLVVMEIAKAIFKYES